MDKKRIEELRQLDYIEQLRKALDIAYMEMGTEARNQTIGPDTKVTVRDVILAAMRGEASDAIRMDDDGQGKGSSG